jgi:hypothetical protein
MSDVDARDRGRAWRMGKGERIMLQVRRVCALVCAVALGSIVSSGLMVRADTDTTKPVKVAGILFDKKDDWITVKADGEDEPVKYVIPSSNKGLVKAMKLIFNAARVQLTYKADGDTRQLVSCKRQVGQPRGTVTGEVVKVHNNFWVEVKPKKGVADAYAPGANFKDKAFMEKLRSLQPGDKVTIQYYTDFERRRIVKLKKH